MEPAVVLSLFATALALLCLRIRHWWRGFAAAGFGLLLGAVATAGLTEDIYLHYGGPLNASGFDSWVLVPAALAMTGVSALPPVPVWRFFQPFVATIFAAWWLLLGSWVA